MIVLSIFCSITALAGDIPESLLSQDKALLFFGEVVSYSAADNHITVLPTKKIKGDVNIETSQIYKSVLLVGKDGFIPIEGEIYLMGYTDENNPLYLFSTTGEDTKTLKIEGIAGFDMWQRMQEYLNDGLYEKKEIERLERIKETSTFSESVTTSVPSSKPLQTSTTFQQASINYWLYSLIGAIIFVVIVIYLRNKKNKKHNQ